jgi:histone-lysine N-methyltransferase SETD1
VPLVPEIEAPPDHLQTPLATYLGDVAGAIRVASNFDGKRKKGERAAMSSQEAYEAEMKARKDDLIREEQEARQREREREKARERAKKSRKGKIPEGNTGRGRRQVKKKTYDLDDVIDEPKKKKTRGKKKKEEPKLPVESAAVQARAQWLEDRTRMSLALHPQFRIGALSIFRLGEAAPAGYVGFHTLDRIFPLNYRACRIFYSFTRNNCRTLYMCRVAAAPVTVGRKLQFKAQFIIQAVDAPTIPCVGDTVGQAVGEVLRRVRNLKEQSMLKDRVKGGRHRFRRKAPPYGLCDDGSGFFGFSLPAVRARIETMPRVTSYALEAELMPLSDRKNLHQLDAQERGKNARRIISYRFCYVRPTPHDILLAQRQAAIRDAQVKPAISGSARSEPRDAIDDIARRSRITRALAQAEEDLEQEKAEALEAGRLREERQARLNNAVVKSRGYKGDEGPKEGSKDWAALKYRELRAVPVLERLAVRRSHIHGWGLYTKVDVERDDFIIEYVGQVIRNNMGDKREEYYDKAGVGSCYLFRLDEDCIVDATRRGHIGRFINHCCSPNAYAKTVEIGPHTRKIVIIALKDIKAGEEVMYDYKFPIEDDKIPCYCGAPNCKGTMN